MYPLILEKILDACIFLDFTQGFLGFRPKAFGPKVSRHIIVKGSY